MKFAHSFMIVLLMSSLTAGWCWAETNTATAADLMQQGGGGQRGGGGNGGGGGQRPQPQPVRPQPQPQPIRPQPQPQPIRPQPQPQPIRPQPQPQPVRPQPQPEPFRPQPQPEPFRPQPQPQPFRPQPQPEPFRPGPGGRAFDPMPVHMGAYPGFHWNHPDFNRPVFQWEWDNLQVVTCTAEDSFGNIYPVTENEYRGIEFQAEMASIEDAALDMCYDDSNGDASCYLLGCAPGY